jgi:hypothetical protein
VIDWDTAGAIGEMLSAIGVIVTLGYLALQIRHSNKLATWETHKSAVEANALTMNAVTTQADVAKIYRTGFMNPDELDEVEKIRFYQLATQMVLNFKDVLDAYDKGLFDFPTYQAWQGFICSHLVMPGGRLWWRDHEQGFVPRVRDEINQGMLEVPRADATSNTFWTSDTPAEILKDNPDRLTPRMPNAR